MIMNEDNKRLLVWVAVILSLPVLLLVGIIGTMVTVVWGDSLDWEEMLEMWYDLGRLVCTGKMKWED